MKIVGMSLLVMFHLIVGEVVGGRPAAALTLDFETLSDTELVTTQFAGHTFTNAIALVSGTAGGILNEVEFPPHSGVTVVCDYFGAITITFDTPVGAASGFFTYAAPVTITAFDAQLVAVDTATSAFQANSRFSGRAGSVPNEMLEVAFAGGISSLTLQGDADGLSFTLDDFSFVPVASVPVAAAESPVPALLALAGATLIGVVGSRRRRTASTTGRRVAGAY
jgi:hypothetical protein